MDTEQQIQILRQASLFKGIDHDQLSAFVHQGAYQLVHYNKNDVIALMGQPLTHLLLVLSGNCIARMVSDSGKYIQIEKIGPGRILAPAMLFATNHVFPVQVVPEDQVTLLKITKRSFLHALQQNETLLFNFIQIVSDVNQFLSQKIHFLALKSLRGKLAHFLLQLAQEQDQSVVTLAYTRQELADKFGVSRQSLIRSLTELEEEGLIGVKQRRITILRSELLRQET